MELNVASDVAKRWRSKWRLSRRVLEHRKSFGVLSHCTLILHFPTSYETVPAMPGLGPSLVFAAGLAIGVGAGSFLPKGDTKRENIPVLPPPPVEKYDVVNRVPTAGGSAALQGGFPGMSLSCAILERSGKEGC